MEIVAEGLKDNRKPPLAFLQKEQQRIEAVEHKVVAVMEEVFQGMGAMGEGAMRLAGVGSVQFGSQPFGQLERFENVFDLFAKHVVVGVEEVQFLQTHELSPFGVFGHSVLGLCQVVPGQFT